MAYIERIAYHLKQRDEVPNQELARELAAKEDKDGIKEIAGYLNDKNKSIASDCLKVLYEIGYLKPALISPYTNDYIQMLQSKNNRMVWGAMIALSSVAKVDPAPVFVIKDTILNLIETGTVITNVWGVYTLIHLAANGYYEALRDDLFMLQNTCRNVDFAKRAESMIEVISEADLNEYITMLEERLPSLSSGGQKRLKALLKKHQK